MMAVARTHEVADHRLRELLKAERKLDRLRSALEAIANAEIPGVSGGPHGASVEVMEFARRALDDAA